MRARTVLEGAQDGLLIRAKNTRAPIELVDNHAPDAGEIEPGAATHARLRPLSSAGACVTQGGPMRSRASVRTRAKASSKRSASGRARLGVPDATASEPMTPSVWSARFRHAMLRRPPAARVP